MQASSWIGVVRRVITDLKSLNHVIENEFPAVSSNLMVFLSASRRLHADIAELAVMVSGEQAQGACHSLISVRRFAREMQRQSEASGRALLVFKLGADRIRRGCWAFSRIAAAFRTTAILTRIEVAHLITSQQNLKNLADDVRSCGEAMRMRASQILKAATDLDLRLASTLDHEGRFEAIQMRELPTLLAEVDSDVELFQARQQVMAKVSSQLAVELDTVTRNLGATATQIQFHDITRQQTEHVIAALEELVHNAPSNEITAAVANVLRLQRIHLQNAASAFLGSTKKIDLELEDIGVRVAEMAAEGNRVHDREPENSDSFLSCMERRFAAIAQAVSELDALDRSARETLGELPDAIRDLGTVVSEVQSIESQLALISINGVLSARRMGNEGEALSKIAGMIGGLRLESEARSGDAKAALDSIREALESLERERMSGLKEASGAALLEDLKGRLGELQSASTSASAATAQIATRAGALLSNLQTARNHLIVGSIFAETAQRCSDELEGLAGQAQPSTSAGVTFSDVITDGRYTMKKERDLHLAMAGGPLNIQAEQDSPAGATEYGDMEFF